MTESENIDHNEEQSQETAAAPTVVPREDLTAAHEHANALLEALADIPNGDMVGEIVANAMKLLRDRVNRGDIKLVNKSFKELRYALKIFSPYRDTRKVSIFGSARTPENHPDYQAALEFSRKMAEAGWMVITGAGGGIMAAGHGGAGKDPSFGLAIRLPFEQATNPFIAGDKKLINFKYFFTRKLMFVRSSHATALFPGGFGTMDEGFEVLTLIQTGKSIPQPIVFIDHPGGTYWNSMQEFITKQVLGAGLISKEDLNLYKITDSVDDAVREVTHFYSNFHSIRYSRDDIIVRLQRAPTEKQLDEMAEKFAGIIVKGKFRVSAPLPVERDEPALKNLPRLVFTFNKRNHGQLRRLIDYLNDLPS